MRHLSSTIYMQRSLSVAVPVMIALGTGTAASADSRAAAKATLGATVAVEWQQSADSGLAQPQVDGELRTAYGWIGRGDAVATSLASGTIVSADGLIVTLAGGTEKGEATVTLPGGRSLPAKRLVVDRRSRLALLRVDADELDPVTLAEQSPEAGETVLSAMCLDTEDRIVAKGIVASAERDVPGFPFKLIQTDLEVTPMSAGAPVVNEAGKLLGVIAATESEGKDKHRPALAVPAEKVRELLDARTGDDSEVVVDSGFLGVSLADHEGSIVVGSVVKDSPAAHVDIEEGDEILAVDGQDVATTIDVLNMISANQAGDVVALELEREGELVKVRVRLGERPQKKAETVSQTSDRDQGLPWKVEWVQPPKVYALDTDGEMHTVDPTTGLFQSFGGAPQAGVTSEWKDLTWPQHGYSDEWSNLFQFQPQAPVLRVERTDLDTRLESLTGEVESLRKQVEALTEQLKQLREQLNYD